jgi:hypothetical protein
MVRTTRRGKVTRLNIYLPDPTLRRLVKTAAARQDISVSEYCVRAISSQLARDREAASTQADRSMLQAAVDRARRFQELTFGGRVLKVSSAELIRQTRRQRTS